MPLSENAKRNITAWGGIISILTGAFAAVMGTKYIGTATGQQSALENNLTVTINEKPSNAVGLAFLKNTDGTCTFKTGNDGRVKLDCKTDVASAPGQHR